MVKNGSIQPVAIECEIGYGEIHTFRIGILKRDVTLYIHAVFEVFIEVILLSGSELNSDAYGDVFVCAERYYTVAAAHTVNIVSLLGIVKHISLFGHGYAVY